MISEEFVRRFLWDRDLANSDTSDFPLCNDVLLPSAILSELNSLVSLAFSNVEKACATTTEAFLDLPLQRKCAVISCPQSQGTQIIDAAIRHVAQKQDADVLVLDALELACGKFGSLGPDGVLIDKLYRRSEDCSPADDGSFLDRDTLQFFEDLLTVSLRPTFRSQPLQRRIIYMRNFQLIDLASKPLMTYILHSLYYPFAPNYPPNPYALVKPRPLPSPRFTPLLVFGCNLKSEHSLVIDNRIGLVLKDHLFLSSLLTHTQRIISSVNNIPLECPAAEALTVPFEPHLGTKVSQLVENAVGVTIFALNVKADAVEETWQNTARANTLRTLNRAKFRACLEHLMGEQFLDADLPLYLMPDSAILGVADATTVAYVTMSLADADSHSRELPQPFEAYVEEAFDIYKRAQKERSNWTQTSDVHTSNSDSSSNDATPTPLSTSNSDSKPPAQPMNGSLSPQAQSLIGRVVDVESISTTFEDVFVDPETIESLQTVISLPLLHPSYFSCGILAKEAIGGILLYGPPGTGKTMLCRALAKSSHARMLHIQPSDINDKYFGEAEKRVSAVFELAYKISPCIIFIDEIDALFSSRTDDTKPWERNVLTEFMQGMDGLRSTKRNKDSHVVVVGATNRPYDLDHAVLRRMPRRILVDTPNLQMRLGILWSYLRDEVLNSDVSIDQLAIDTEGFSGSDLKNLCVAAALASVKEAIGPRWKEPASAPPSPGPINSATPVDDDTRVSKGGQAPDLPNRTISAANIRQARREISKSITRNPMGRLYVWHRSHSTGESE